MGTVRYHTQLENQITNKLKFSWEEHESISSIFAWTSIASPDDPELLSNIEFGVDRENHCWK